MTILVEEAKLEGGGRGGEIRTLQLLPTSLLPPPNEFFKQHPEEAVGQGGSAH